jgi:hypothetical protein
MPVAAKELSPRWAVVLSYGPIVGPRSDWPVHFWDLSKPMRPVPHLPGRRGHDIQISYYLPHLEEFLRRTPQRELRLHTDVPEWTVSIGELSVLRLFIATIITKEEE